ncbi:hypothetical protein BSF42_28720 [Flavobacterium sp. ACN6]|nr:hypothetical protein BSF42_28720 [Flavobacterium sp. ACN6]
MKQIRIILYVITLLYVVAVFFFHVNFEQKKIILFILIAGLIIFDLIIPNVKKYFNKVK